MGERVLSPNALRVGFAGTPLFAARALAAIADAGFTIPVVLTRPDKPKGRGLAVEASDVAREARGRSLRVEQPPSLKAVDAATPLLQTPIDVLVVAAYGLILPQHVLAWPRHGCLNIHASMLPRWRGAAPIQRALEAGDAQSGITIMQMDAGLDTGPIVSEHPVRIEARETAGSLHAKLMAVGASAIVDALRTLEHEGRLDSRPQPEDGATYAAKVMPRDARIDWTRDATSIDRQVRAFDPVPGASATLEGAAIKVWRAEPAAVGASGAPGTIAVEGDVLVVACGKGALRISELQPGGGRRMSARAFAAGRSLHGASFSAAAS
jgi:methionyl-tRNA formyltransferase